MVSFDDVENSHQQACSSDGVCGFCDIVVVHISVPSRIPEYGVGTGKKCPSPLALAAHCIRIGQRAIFAERLVHQIDPDKIVPETTECTNPHLDRLHRDEHGLFVLAEQELPTRSALDLRVEALCELVERANVIEALRERLSACPGYEYGKGICLFEVCRDQPSVS